jgi:pilus assembly protein CpaB
MDRRFLTVLGISLVFALVVSSVFYQMTARSGGNKRSEAAETRDLVVATRPLSVGVMVKPPDIKVVKIGTEGFPKGAFSKVEEVLDRPVVSNILLDEPILEGRLAVKGSGLGLAPTIPVGMRAVSVRVNDVAGVAGFVLPACASTYWSPAVRLTIRAVSPALCFRTFRFCPPARLFKPMPKVRRFRRPPSRCW